MTTESFQAVYHVAGRDLSPTALIHQYLYVVKNAVRKICAAGPLPKDVDKDDLLQIGQIALCEAASRFDDSRGTRFEAFAALRALGAMRDYLRQISWCPRTMTRRKRMVEEAEHELIARLERMPTAEEIATHLTWAIEDLHAVMQMLSSHAVLSLDFPNGMAVDAEGNAANLANALTDPDDGVEASVAIRAFRDIILACMMKSLDPKEQLVFRRRYLEQKPLSRIAEELGLSPTRIAKISSNAREKVASVLRQEHPDFVPGAPA